MDAPTCFISYSWDSEMHKNWIRTLAETLQESGIWTYLDQWDVNLGANLTNYMESKIRESDYVLLICTPHFALKANDGRGGVGYEKSIVSGEIYHNISSPEKFVPLIREGVPGHSLPSYLKSRLFIDFRDDHKFNEQIEELLRHILKKPKYIRPKLGTPPELDPELRINNSKMKSRTFPSNELAKVEANALNLKRDPSFVKYKEGLYTILKKEGFEFNEQENHHSKTFLHKQGEKLYFIVAEEEIYNRNTKKAEPHFVFVREYITFEKNDQGEYKKVIVNENQSIPITQSFEVKKDLLNKMLMRMEIHLVSDEKDIKKISLQSERIMNIITAILMIPLIAFLIWIYSKCA